MQPEANVSMTEYQKGVVMEKVHEVQKTITHIIDVCDDALCSVCGQRTYLPLVYHENLLQAKSLKVRQLTTFQFSMKIIPILCTATNAWSGIDTVAEKMVNKYP